MDNTNKTVICSSVCIGHDKIKCYKQNWMKVYHGIDIYLNLGEKNTIINTVIKALALAKLIIASLENSR